MIPFHWKLTMTCLEDLHVGNGLSHLGEYDSGHAVAKDGTPWIPHTTLMGMIREGCRKVEAECTIDPAFRQELFEFSTGDSLLLEPLRMILRPDPFVLQAFTAVTLEGVAKEHSLRMVQCVRRGTQFQGSLYGQVSRPEILEFLEQGILRIKRIGGQRNRGFGKVEWKIDQHSVPELRIPACKPSEPDAEGGTLWILYKLQDTVSIGNRAQANNLQFSQDYIRSENVLGAWRHLLRTVFLPLAGSEVSSLNLLDEDSGLVLSSLYPFPSSKEFPKSNPLSVIPFPKSLQLPKASSRVQFTGTQDKMYLPHWFNTNPDAADLKTLRACDQFSPRELEREDETTPKDETRPKYKKESGFLLHKGEQDFTWIKPSKTRVLRNRVNEKTGNVQENSLFVEEGLQEDSWFVGSIYFPNQGLRQCFEQLFAPWLPQEDTSAQLPLGIGRGRKIMRAWKTRWFPANETREQVQNLAIAGTAPLSLKLLFLADALFLDSKGQGSALTESLLAEYLGVPEACIKISHKAESLYEYMPMHSNGGFFMPAQRLIAKGSAYHLTFSEADAYKMFYDKLQNLAFSGSGLGEWTSSGYGRFVLNHPVHQLYDGSKVQDTSQGSWVLADSLFQTDTQEARFRQAKALYETYRLSKLSDSSGISQLSGLLAVLESKPSVADRVKIFERLQAHSIKVTDKLWKKTVQHEGNTIPLWHFLKDHLSSELLLEVLRYWISRDKTKPQETNIPDGVL
ncbi:MAG: hypothetical protein HQM12_20355 [SAR324 cluster bacterium]|nr:hypothetical protein [SAR324 cluster bacterium]